MRDLRQLWQWWQGSRPGRALARYSERGGNVLCGGMAYTALFSLFAGLTIGYTAFSAVLGGDAQLREEVLSQVDRWIPGLIDTGSGGAIKPEQLLLTSGFNVTSVIAVVVLLWSATGFMGALRVAVRSMFDLSDDGPNVVVARLLQLAGFVLLLAGVLVAAAFGVAVSTAAPWLLDQIGLGGASRVVVQALGILVGVVVDAMVVAGVIRYVAGVRIPRRELLAAAGVVGVTTGVLRWAGSSIILESASRNALLAGFAVLVGVLILVNLVARVLLLSCAWAAEAGGRHAGAAAPSKG
ncbi:YihY/virulence factor BrkB family protein [Myceligenerans indicum]|uniref:YihY/virulence factor BrkB family protein n=1 Tax=Myceligenerans indicum TaxID=2593663 RepID=A0ABS1LFI0_9MICO|nr:YihY/virulence factor BrkB family protein [Myceligenerans indicum]MBL0884997.1 YihY/virulence factor BrkB family protein [Myceligenerans indicum]